MAADKSPAFQFYPKDFLADGNVIEMSLEERGAYITLLCVCWQEGSLPAKPDRLAQILRTPPKVFRKLWPVLERCFVEQDGRLVHRRLEKEREKQDHFRRRQTDAAASRWHKPERSHGIAKPMPNTCSPISDLQSPISDLQKNVPKEPTARSKRPIFTGQKLTVFDWMLDDCLRTLGQFGDDFDLHEWFYALDAQAFAANWVIPKRDGGVWLQAQLLAEAHKRGLPLLVATAEKTSRPAYTGWACPHTPVCEDGRWRCEQKSALDAVRKAG